MKRILILIAIAACGHAPPAGGGGGGGSGSGAIGNTAEPGGTGPHEMMATLERTACYGTCPIYRLTVYRDGAVEYDGEQFVKVKGKATGQITADQVTELDAAFVAAHYFDLEDKYTDYEMTDMPSANTSYAGDGKHKAIEHYYGDSKAPPALQTLEDAIDRIVHVDQWIGTDAEREHNSYN